MFPIVGELHTSLQPSNAGWRISKIKSKMKTQTVKLPDSSRIKSNGHSAAPSTNQTHVTITPPNIQTASFTIEGTAPLVVHRFDKKVMQDFEDKIVEGSGR